MERHPSSNPWQIFQSICIHSVYSGYNFSAHYVMSTRIIALTWRRSYIKDQCLPIISFHWFAIITDELKDKRRRGSSVYVILELSLKIKSKTVVNTSSASSWKQVSAFFLNLNSFLHQSSSVDGVKFMIRSTKCKNNHYRARNRQKQDLWFIRFWWKNINDYKWNVV